MKPSTTYVEANRTAKIVAIALFLLYVLSLTVIIDWSRYPFRLSLDTGKGLHVMAMLVAWSVVWASALYLLYLAYVSLPGGVFPPSKAVVPFRTKQISGAWAYLACCIALVAAVLLIALPLVWKHEMDWVSSTMERMKALGIEPRK